MGKEGRMKEGREKRSVWRREGKEGRMEGGREKRVGWRMERKRW